MYLQLDMAQVVWSITIILTLQNHMVSTLAHITLHYITWWLAPPISHLSKLVKLRYVADADVPIVLSRPRVNFTNDCRHLAVTLTAPSEKMKHSNIIYMVNFTSQTKASPFAKVMHG